MNLSESNKCENRSISRPSIVVVAIACTLFLYPAASAKADNTTLISLNDSIKPISGPPYVPPKPSFTSQMMHVASIGFYKASPTPKEQSLLIEIALKAREQESLLSHKPSDKASPGSAIGYDHSPSPETYQKVLDWIDALHLRVFKKDAHRLTVFVQATPTELTNAFQVSFVEKSINGTSYVIAATPPKVSAEIAPLLIGINGLQPQVRILQKLPTAPVLAASGQSWFFPTDLMRAYGASSLNLTGNNQTIGIVCFDSLSVSPNDLKQFWSLCGVSDSVSNIDTPAYTNAASAEATMDVEWASAIAPRAHIKLYTLQGFPVASDVARFELLIQSVMDDLDNQNNMRQISITHGYNEQDVGVAQVTTDRVKIAVLAKYKQGITIFASSGDCGSNPPSTISSGANIAQVSYPAADDNVTAVGGTNLRYSSSAGVIVEQAWQGSGGGMSAYVPRPPWQVGNSFPVGTTRLVPDVAIAAQSSPQGLIWLNGGPSVANGTSWGAPVWAAFSAIINQASVNLDFVGGPSFTSRLYTLLGNNAVFRQVLTGSNGTYSAGPNYNLCTGLGVPVVSELVGNIGK